MATDTATATIPGAQTSAQTIQPAQPARNTFPGTLIAADFFDVRAEESNLRNLAW